MERKVDASADFAGVDSHSGQITISLQRRTLTMHSLTETELDALASSGPSVNLGFLGMSFGAFVSFGIVLLTVELRDSMMHATFLP
jgi:hypothetical protein